eukprot:4616447-Amphidinium_carterae.1
MCRKLLRLVTAPRSPSYEKRVFSTKSLDDPNWHVACARSYTGVFEVVQGFVVAQHGALHYLQRRAFDCSYALQEPKTFQMDPLEIQGFQKFCGTIDCKPFKLGDPNGEQLQPLPTCKM